MCSALATRPRLTRVELEQTYVDVTLLVECKTLRSFVWEAIDDEKLDDVIELVER